MHVCHRISYKTTLRSLEKAKAFSVAIRQLLSFSEETWKQGNGSGARMRHNHEFLHRQLAEVETWIVNNDSSHGSSVNDVDFTEFDCRQ